LGRICHLLSQKVQHIFPLFSLSNQEKFNGGFETGSLIKLARQSEVWKGVVEDIRQVESYLGEQLGPVTPEEIEYANILKKLHQKKESGELFVEYLQELAVLRKSIG